MSREVNLTPKTIKFLFSKELVKITLDTILSWIFDEILEAVAQPQVNTFVRWSLLYRLIESRQYLKRRFSWEPFENKHIVLFLMCSPILSNKSVLPWYFRNSSIFRMKIAYPLFTLNWNVNVKCVTCEIIRFFSNRTPFSHFWWQFHLLCFNPYRVGNFSSSLIIFYMILYRLM